jgi:hypothetical protein
LSLLAMLVVILRDVVAEAMTAFQLKGEEL